MAGRWYGSVYSRFVSNQGEPTKENEAESEKKKRERERNRERGREKEKEGGKSVRGATGGQP